MNNATSKQIVTTLANMRSEVAANGISEAASDMWLHALTLYRRDKGLAPVPASNLEDLPMLLRRQAE